MLHEVFGDCFAAIELSNGERFTTEALSRGTGDGGAEAFAAGDFYKPELRWRARPLPGQSGFVVTLDVTNTTARRLSVERLDVLVAPTGFRHVPFDQVEYSQTGWMSWSYASPPQRLANLTPQAPPPVIGPMLPPSEAERWVPPWMTQIRSRRGSGVLGFQTASRYAGIIHVQPVAAGTHRLTASCYVEGVELEPGASISSEPLLFVPAETDEAQALDRYAKLVAQAMEARQPERVTTGWCSWYHFFTGVTEADVRANLQVLHERRDTIPVEVIQLDDGYQTAVGDWLSVNEKFPSGMRALTDAIHAAGFQAGIWLAPFIASEHSQVFREHPDWFLRDHNGLPINALHNWGSFNYALDLTNQAVESWLEEVFATIVHEWGFDYLKIDFIYAGAMRGVRHDRSVTSVQAYRRGLELIRRVAGERFVLGCGAPFLPSVGLVDGMRVGSDTAPYWGAPDPHGSAPSLLNAIRATIAHGWMHKRLWINDPDCLIVRRNESQLSLDEVRSWASVIAMSGGMMLLSDDLNKLPSGWRSFPASCRPSARVRSRCPAPG
jgi:alpha-galactosidase